MLTTAFSALIVLLLVVSTGIRLKRPAWRDEARDLVKKKEMTPEDQGRALQILLHRELSSFGVEDQLRVLFWLFVVLGTFFGIGLLLSAQATTAFEIGKGKVSVMWQKWYAGFLRKSLPRFLFAGVIASVVGSYVFEYLRGN